VVRNTTYKILFYVTKIVLGGKFVATYTYIKKEKELSQSHVVPQGTRKRETNYALS
jgi:hypothetical protein